MSVCSVMVIKGNGNILKCVEIKGIYTYPNQVVSGAVFYVSARCLFGNVAS